MKGGKSPDCCCGTERHRCSVFTPPLIPIFPICVYWLRGPFPLLFFFSSCECGAAASSLTGNKLFFPNDTTMHTTTRGTFISNAHISYLSPSKSFSCQRDLSSRLTEVGAIPAEKQTKPSVNLQLAKKTNNTECSFPPYVDPNTIRKCFSPANRPNPKAAVLICNMLICEVGIGK